MPSSARGTGVIECAAAGIRPPRTNSRNQPFSMLGVCALLINWSNRHCMVVLLQSSEPKHLSVRALFLYGIGLSEPHCEARAGESGGVMWWCGRVTGSKVGPHRRAAPIPAAWLVRSLEISRFSRRRKLTKSKQGASPRQALCIAPPPYDLKHPAPWLPSVLAARAAPTTPSLASTTPLLSPRTPRLCAASRLSASVPTRSCYRMLRRQVLTRKQVAVTFLASGWAGAILW